MNYDLAEWVLNLLMSLFIDKENTEMIAAGIGYLHIEAAFHFGIGLLFLFYGYYRAVHKPGISAVLTVVSPGTRVFLAYVLSAVPIGWILADLTGVWYYMRSRKNRRECMK